MGPPEAFDSSARRALVRLAAQVLGVAALYAGGVLIGVFLVGVAALATCPYALSSGLCPPAASSVSDILISWALGALVLAGGVASYRYGLREPGIHAEPPTPQSASNESQLRRRRRRSVARIATIGVAVIVTLGFLALLPVDHSFSGELATSCWPKCADENASYSVSGAQAVPGNSYLSVDWTDVSGSFVSFGVNIFVSGQWVGCTQTGADGVCTLNSPTSGNLYTISVSDESSTEGVQVVTYSGFYTGPTI